MDEVKDMTRIDDGNLVMLTFRHLRSLNLGY